MKPGITQAPAQSNSAQAFSNFYKHQHNDEARTTLRFSAIQASHIAYQYLRLDSSFDLMCFQFLLLRPVAHSFFLCGVRFLNVLTSSPTRSSGYMRFFLPFFAKTNFTSSSLLGLRKFSGRVLHLTIMC